ncbi:hypothetical protein D3C71_1236090 [compost metagenome]
MLPRFTPTTVKPPWDEVPLLMACTLVSKVKLAVSSTAVTLLVTVFAPSEITSCAEALAPLWPMV